MAEIWHNSQGCAHSDSIENRFMKDKTKVLSLENWYISNRLLLAYLWEQLKLKFIIYHNSHINSDGCEWSIALLNGINISEAQKQ